MQEVSSRNFGLLIAYLIPGLLVLWGLSFESKHVDLWLAGADQAGPSIGGFLYVTLASVGCGMTANALRWVVVDGLHHLTGLQRPHWSDASLHDRFQGYTWLVENHYRYYQFYANMIIATAFAYVLWRTSPIGLGNGITWIDAAVVGLLTVFFTSSRSALRNYYSRAVSLLGESEERAMNGGRHPKEEKKKQDKTKGAKSNSTESKKSKKD